MSLVTAMVLARLDYGSITLNGITQHLMNRLQSVLNAAARLVCRPNSRKYDRISPFLRDLHWLCVPERIVWPFWCSAAATIQHLNICRGNYSGQSTTNRDDDCGQRRLRGWSYSELDSQQLATAPSAQPLLALYRTVCQPTLSLHSRWQLSRGS